MSIEREVPLKEIVLEEISLNQIELEPAGQSKILDESGNPIRDHVGRFIYDD